jgi:hypothetical protein
MVNSVLNPPRENSIAASSLAASLDQRIPVRQATGGFAEEPVFGVLSAFFAEIGKYSLTASR